MEYTIKLPQKDIQIIINALGELPLKISASTFGNIQRQVQVQDAENAIDIGKPEAQG